MISHPLKAIYFHIGKAAGTSVEKLLDNKKRDHKVADYDDFYGYDRDHNIYLQHASAAFMRDNVDRNIFDNYYKFSVVRNPYERLVSVYHYLIDQHTKEFGSFEGYINTLPNLVSQSNLLKGSHHIAQSCYTHIEGQQICDYIAHFENLPNSLNPVTSKLNLKTELGKHNVGRFYNWQVKPVPSYYTKEMINIVIELFKADFESYGYSLDPNVRHSEQ